MLPAFQSLGRIEVMMSENTAGEINWKEECDSQFGSKSMKLHLLGTGTPILDPQRQATTAILIEIGSEKVLFDAGRGVTTQLLKQDIHPTTVDAIFITHHHYDHICDLGELLLTTWHNGRVQPIHVFGPNGTSDIVAALFNQVYARDIAFALFNPVDLIDIRQLVKVEDVLPGLDHAFTIPDFSLNTARKPLDIV
jgi:phosphoribosyl 1,2-cyclic phosphodiesterase